MLTYCIGPCGLASAGFVMLCYVYEPSAYLPIDRPASVPLSSFVSGVAPFLSFSHSILIYGQYYIIVLARGRSGPLGVARGRSLGASLEVIGVALGVACLVGRSIAARIARLGSGSGWRPSI